MIISVPSLEEDAWPTLGPQVCKWIETFLVFGPGDLQGMRARLDDEKRALIYRAYEIYPIGSKDPNGKPIAGRRRFRRVGLSLQKGSAKTELAAWIAAAELSPDSPVRCDGFDAFGKPVGRPVQSPYIPMVAYTEEQSSDLAYGVLKDLLERSPISNLFDIGVEKITQAGNPAAKCMALAGAPDSRDGALTTFQHEDETHRFNTTRLRSAHRTMLANLPKRLLAEPWGLETTTAYIPGQDSVAEQTATYAKDVADGKIKDSRLFYFHRQASDDYDVTDQEQLRRAIIEAAGPTAPWRDIEGILDQWQDPAADRPYLERVYLNKPIATASQAFSPAAWKRNTAKREVTKGAKVVGGFDGSIKEDATALIGTEVESGYQWVVGIWDKPPGRGDDWEVPRLEVDAAVEEFFGYYNVLRLYADPSKWETWLATWAGRYGDKKVAEWSTTAYRKMATALKAYAGAINAGEALNDGHPTFARHIANAQKNVQSFIDDDGSPLWLIRKDRPMSPNKIDAAMAGALSWRARLDVIAAGALNVNDWHGIYIPKAKEPGQ